MNSLDCVLYKRFRHEPYAIVNLFNGIMSINKRFGGRKMNDCFWGCIDNLCDGKDCNNGKDCDNCKEYISLNSEIGRKLEGEFFNDVQKALKPVNEKWGIKKYLFKV